jgi:hypothetical protein
VDNLFEFFVYLPENLQIRLHFDGEVVWSAHLLVVAVENGNDGPVDVDGYPRHIKTIVNQSVNVGAPSAA